jgi:hypothetical protein
MSAAATQGHSGISFRHIWLDIVIHTLDLSRAKAACPAAEPLLRLAISGGMEIASRGPVPASCGVSMRHSCNGLTAIKVADTAAQKGESCKEMVGLAVRNPLL